MGRRPKIKVYRTVKPRVCTECGGVICPGFNYVKLAKSITHQLKSECDSSLSPKDYYRKHKIKKQNEKYGNWRLPEFNPTLRVGQCPHGCGREPVTSTMKNGKIIRTFCICQKNIGK